MMNHFNVMHEMYVLTQLNYVLMVFVDIKVVCLILQGYYGISPKTIQNYTV
jgi:hypothetical protein